MASHVEHFSPEYSQSPYPNGIKFYHRSAERTSGQRVPLDLNRLNQFSIFPGQVINNIQSFAFLPQETLNIHVEVV